MLLPQGLSPFAHFDLHATQTTHKVNKSNSGRNKRGVKGKDKAKEKKHKDEDRARIRTTIGQG